MSYKERLSRNSDLTAKGTWPLRYQAPFRAEVVPDLTTLATLYLQI